jgi:hypothetical protein
VFQINERKKKDWLPLLLVVAVATVFVVVVVH